MNAIEAWLRTNGPGIAGWVVSGIATWLAARGFDLSTDQKAQLIGVTTTGLGIVFTIVSNTVKSKTNPMNVSTKELRNNPAASQGTGDGSVRGTSKQ